MTVWCARILFRNKQLWLKRTGISHTSFILASALVYKTVCSCANTAISPSSSIILLFFCCFDAKMIVALVVIISALTISGVAPASECQMGCSTLTVPTGQCTQAFTDAFQQVGPSPKIREILGEIWLIVTDDTMSMVQLDDCIYCSLTASVLSSLIVSAPD